MTDQQIIKQEAKTIQQLTEKDVLIKIGSAYVFNPKLVNAFGSDRKNRSILIEFRNAKEKEHLKRQDVENKV